MIRSEEILGLPIISIHEGQQLGTVKGLIIDTQKIVISAIVVSSKGILKDNYTIPFNKIHSIGSHAVTVVDNNSVEKGSSQQLSNLNTRTIIGIKVISEKGNAIGQVKDFFLDSNTGKVLALEINNGLLEGMLRKHYSLASEYVKTMGKDVILIKENGEQHLIPLDNHLYQRVKTASDSTVKVIENTWSKTKKLSKNWPVFKQEQSMTTPDKEQSDITSVNTTDNTTDNTTAEKK